MAYRIWAELKRCRHSTQGDQKVFNLRSLKGDGALQAGIEDLPTYETHY